MGNKYSKNSNSALTFLDKLCNITKKNGLSMIVIFFLMGDIAVLTKSVIDFKNTYEKSTENSIATVKYVSEKYNTLGIQVKELDYDVKNVQLSLGVIHSKEKIIIEEITDINKSLDELNARIDNLKTVTTYEGQVTRASK